MLVVLIVSSVALTGAMLSDGPPLAQDSGGLGGGFFYDVWLPDRLGVQPQHLTAINKLCADIIKGTAASPSHLMPLSFIFLLTCSHADDLRWHVCSDTGRQPMERLVVSRAFAEQLFADNLLKLHILRRQIPACVTHVTLYRCGNLVDLCRGPHLPHTAVPKGLCPPLELCFAM
jgi:hypothetical protein